MSDRGPSRDEHRERCEHCDRLTMHATHSTADLTLRVCRACGNKRIVNHDDGEPETTESKENITQWGSDDA